MTALTFLSATGNRFAVHDTLRDGPLADPRATAVELARESGVDGLLLVLPDGHAPVRMRVVNADGSFAEACGNGLRCVAKLAFERGHALDEQFSIATDAGLRRVTVILSKGSVVRVRAETGPIAIGVEAISLDVGDAALEGHVVDVGNPHVVVFVDDVEAVPVESWGPRIERDPRFPQRTNVEFVALRPNGGGLDVRIFERGVGETASCGTGVSAAAACAVQLGIIGWPVHVITRGGTLTVAEDERCRSTLEGEVRTYVPTSLTVAG